jgi:hypothetical protein
MTSRSCEEYTRQENGEAHGQEDEVRRRKKNFQCEVVKENPLEESGISNRLFSSTFIPPLTMPNCPVLLWSLQLCIWLPHHSAFCSSSDQ